MTTTVEVGVLFANVAPWLAPLRVAGHPDHRGVVVTKTAEPPLISTQTIAAARRPLQSNAYNRLLAIGPAVDYPISQDGAVRDAKENVPCA